MADLPTIAAVEDTLGPTPCPPILLENFFFVREQKNVGRDRRLYSVLRKIRTTTHVKGKGKGEKGGGRTRD